VGSSLANVANPPAVAYCLHADAARGEGAQGVGFFAGVALKGAGVLLHRRHAAERFRGEYP
jgi:uncharacterized protein (TIGR03382 family)